MPDEPKGTLSLGASIDASLLANSSFVGPIRGHRLDRWQVRADAGSETVVRVESDAVDAVLYVLRDDSVLYSDDRSPGNRNSQLAFSMPESGEVIVLAGSYFAEAEGDYSLLVAEAEEDSLLVAEEDYSRLLQEAPDEPKGTLSLGAFIDASLANSSFVGPIRGHRLDRWQVRADAGSETVVRVESDAVDAVLYVLRDDSVLYSDDRSPWNRNSQLAFSMPESGEVTVLAGSYSPEAEGDYSLLVVEAEDDYSQLLQKAPEPRGTLIPTSRDRDVGRQSG